MTKNMAQGKRSGNPLAALFICKKSKKGTRSTDRSVSSLHWDIKSRVRSKSLKEQRLGSRMSEWEMRRGVLRQ